MRILPVKLSIQDVKTPRQWRSAVGCDAHQFDQLLQLFSQAYETLNGAQLPDRMVISPTGVQMKEEAYLLFFTLFSCQSGLTYDVLGLVCGMDGATAKRRQDEGLVVLREALRLADCLPEREFDSPAEIQRYFPKRRAILLDATEFETQRPKEKGAQKARYGGKKNAIRSKP